MLSKRTVVDKREITESGVIQVRLRKEVVEDDNVLAFEYHRFCVSPGEDLSVILAAVNAHLLSTGSLAVDAAGTASIQRIVDAEHKK